MLNFILAIMVSLSCNTVSYADNTYANEVEQVILSDKGFLERISATTEQVKEILENKFFATYLEFESQNQNGEISANWNILEWHAEKIKNFLEYVFTGNTSQQSYNPPSHRPSHDNTNWNRSPRRQRNNCECGCWSCVNCYYKNNQND